MAKKKSIPNTPSEQHRFEILLEEIRSQLKLVCENQLALAERMDRLELGMQQMRKEFYQFVSNVHGELSGRIDEVGNQVKEVKEILIAHDRRIGTLEHT